MNGALRSSWRLRGQRFVIHLAQPSALAVLVMVLASATAVVSAQLPIQDPDGWWVAAAGREMLRSGSVPRENLYSFTEPEHRWVMHEWLLGPLYAWGLTGFGPGFFVGLTLVSFGLALSLLLAGTLRRAAHAQVGLASLAVLIACFGKRFTSARPSSVALLLPLALTLVAFAPRFRRRQALAAVSLEWLWTNVHGSFPLGVALLGLSALERRRDRRRRVLAMLTAALVTLLNPYGMQLHGLVASYLLGRKDIFQVIHRDIDEFRSLFSAWGTTVGTLEVLGLALALALALAALRHPPWRWRGVFCVLLVSLAMKQARHVELAGLLSGLLLLPLLERYRLILPASFRSRYPRSARRLWPRLAGVPLACGVLVAWFVPRPVPGNWIHAGPGFLSALEQVEPGTRLFVPFQQGGLVTWYGFPRRIRVFIDPRNDCYSAAAFEAFRLLSTSATPLERVLHILDEHGVDQILVPPAHALGQLPRQQGWSQLSRTGDWLRLGRHPPAPPGSGR